MELPRSPGHPFYERVNGVLGEAGFDRFVEDLCRPHYAAVQGRPSIPPGTYFRMLMVGYFEGIDSQRGIAWRCSDSLALREFLGLSVSERVPECAADYSAVPVHVMMKGAIRAKTCRESWVARHVDAGVEGDGGG
jgi:hypothetical protein